MRKTENFNSKQRATMLCAALIAMAVSIVQAASFVHQASNRVTVSLDRSWWFNSTDNSGYSATSLNDSTGTWSKVCLPQQNRTVKHAYCNGGSASGSGAEWQFNSWYRKHYTVPAAYSGRRFFLEFEGVSNIATVYVNGTQVGTHSGGYTPFTIDITSQIVTGSDNVIAVLVNSQLQSGVPPETGGNIDFCVFGGIVRNVNLTVTDPLHVEWNWVSIPNATSQTSTPNGTVMSHVKVVNNAATSKTVTATTSLVDNTGNVVTTGTGTATIAAGGSSIITYATSGAVTKFWSPDAPNLHTVYTQLQDGSTYVDEHVDRTGFRTIWPLTQGTVYTGIYINGTRIKVFGLNRHETFPFIGRAAARRLQRKDADILKYDLGCNLVRCSHYTQSSDFIKRCDEVGLMLIQEVPGWQNVGGGGPSTAGTWQGLLMQGLKEMIYRDRNRPSVISFGVRVNESGDNDALYGPMNDTARAIDPSRPTHGVRKSGTTSFLEDFWTQNFADPAAGANAPWITTESVGHTITPQVHSWDNDVQQFGQINGHVSAQSTAAGSAYSMGKLGWCAFDYQSCHANATTVEVAPSTADPAGRSKSSPYVSPHGVASIFRIPKLAAYFFQSQRSPSLYGPMVFIANDWTASSPTTVTVFSNCDQVSFYLNGALISTQSPVTGTNLAHPKFSFTIPAFVSGTLRAVGLIGGVQSATHQVSTPSAPTRLVLTPDTNVIYDGGDMTRVVVSLVDSSGRAIRSRGDSITMSASGAGDFIGEARSALEGGQFAFYVKSRDGVTGTIAAAATDITTSVTAGSATITVITDPTTGVKYESQQALVSSTNIQKPLFTKVWGNRFILPPGVPENARISVYDIAGRIVYQRTTQSAKVIDLGKTINASNAVYIVKIETGRAVAVK